MYKNPMTVHKHILLPLPFAHGFDYRVPEHMEVRAGDYVRVPFGRKSLWGVVWGEAEGGVEEKKIKEIEAIAAHLPPMSDAMRGFIDWVSWYTLAAKGLVLKMALPLPEALEPPATEIHYGLNKEATVKPTPARLRIQAYLADGTTRSPQEIMLHAKVSANVLREFAKAGGVDVVRCPLTVTRKIISSDNEQQTTDNAVTVPALSPAQHEAATQLRSKLAAGFSVSVLDGVTGSGKTEVYFDMIEQCLGQNRQAVVMLPEIALSVQWLTRFQARFGFAPDVWHSNVSPAKKRGSWRGIAEGSVRVVIGARSALFLPFRTLGAIIVDEEHDASYKQEEGVIYHARDMAVARASREKIPIVLVSATPSLETEYNIQHGRYARLHLPSRHGEAELPKVTLLDMRKDSPARGNWISEPLKRALLETIAHKRQAMLFMNRRGYAPLLLCRGCGHRFECPHCTASLVLHRSHARLLCHHCGHIVPVPKECPECKKEDSLIPYGPGVERIAEEARALLPNARIAVMTSDNPVSADTLINGMVEGDIDLLVGTQMIAKGHHFAGLALVGVIDADMGLAGGDLRAGERTYQLLHQLSGRAGREKIRGEVLLQTYMPEHPVMQALMRGDRDQFMLLEARMREDASMPPYGKLASIIIEGKNEQEVANFARSLMRITNHHESQGANIALHSSPLLLGPAPAPLFLLRGKYRYRILIKAERSFALQSWLAHWLHGRKTPASIRIKIDVDPYNFM